MKILLTIVTFSVGLHLALRENINPTAQSGIIIFSPFLKWFLICVLITRFSCVLSHRLSSFLRILSLDSGPTFPANIAIVSTVIYKDKRPPFVFITIEEFLNYPGIIAQVFMASTKTTITVCYTIFFD